MFKSTAVRKSALVVHFDDNCPDGPYIIKNDQSSETNFLNPNVLEQEYIFDVYLPSQNDMSFGSLKRLLDARSISAMSKSLSKIDKVHYDFNSFIFQNQIRNSNERLSEAGVKDGDRIAFTMTTTLESGKCMLI